MIYLTQVRAFDPLTNEMKIWEGDRIEAGSFEEAEKYCRENKGYLEVVGQLVSEIPTDLNGNPMWNLKQDFDGEGFFKNN